MSTDALVSVDGGQAEFSDSVIVVRKSVVVLTDADIKALPTTPIELVPAPAAGSSIVPLMVLAVVNIAVDYTNLDPTYCGIYTQLGSAFATTSMTEDITADVLSGSGPGDLLIFTPYARVLDGFVVASSFSSVVDQPLTLVGDNTAAGNWTGGDPANTMTVTTIYTVI